MSYTARNASRYNLSEYNWSAWSRTYGCALDVNAQCVCAVQGPGRWRHRASAAAVGSEMRRRRSLSPVRSTSVRCTVYGAQVDVPCLLAIPAFDRKAGLNNRHLNSNRGICLR